MSLSVEQNKKMKDLNTGGVIGGVIAWFVIIWLMSNESACLKLNSCDGGDMILFAVVSVGMLVPASIAALLISIIIK